MKPLKVLWLSRIALVASLYQPETGKSYQDSKICCDGAENRTFRVEMKEKVNIGVFFLRIIFHQPQG